MAWNIATPTSVDRTLPPTTDQGWASGLAGTAKTSTAEAPKGATMIGRSGPKRRQAAADDDGQRDPDDRPDTGEQTARKGGSGKQGFEKAHAAFEVGVG